MYKTQIYFAMHVSRTCSEDSADLLWIEVVVHEGIDDGRNILLEEGVAHDLDLGIVEDCSERVTNVHGEVKNLLLSGVAGDEVVDVGHHIDADTADKLVGSVGDSEGGGEEEEEQ